MTESVETVKPCPKCLERDILMTCTDLTTSGGMVYRLRCYTCGYHPPWAPSQEEAIRFWQRAKRVERKEEA